MAQPPYGTQYFLLQWISYNKQKHKYLGKVVASENPYQVWSDFLIKPWEVQYVILLEDAKNFKSHYFYTERNILGIK